MNTIDVLRNVVTTNSNKMMVGCKQKSSTRNSSVQPPMNTAAPTPTYSGRDGLSRRTRTGQLLVDELFLFHLFAHVDLSDLIGDNIDE